MYQVFLTLDFLYYPNYTMVNIFLNKEIYSQYAYMNISTIIITNIYILILLIFIWNKTFFVTDNRRHMPPPLSTPITRLKGIAGSKCIKRNYLQNSRCYASGI